MLSLLHPEVRDHAGEFSRQFASAQPFRHVVFEQFLEPAFCQELMAEFPAFDPRHAVNERGEQGRKAVRSSLPALGPAYARFDRLMRDNAFLAMIERITGIDQPLYDPDYVGGGTHENLDGQELDPHVDFNYHPTRQLHRRLNLIVFLNSEWEECWGGCLELLQDPWATDADTRKIVVPRANRGVIFETTERSWHGFPRIQLPPDKPVSRRSIAVYFYSKDRAVTEAAPSHGTFYYQRPLPGQVQAGHTLTEADVDEIQALLSRRDKQIEFLHGRELEFSKALGGITGSPSFRLGRAITWPARAIRNLLR